MGVVVFLATCWYVLWDGRLRLVAGDSLRPYHPSMLYAYLALTLQGGVVQVGKKCICFLKLYFRIYVRIMQQIKYVGDIVSPSFA